MRLSAAPPLPFISKIHHQRANRKREIRLIAAIPLIAALSLSYSSALAQHQWTWVAGSNDTEATAVYGAPGVAATNVHPGSNSFMATWPEADDSLWMYGGFGHGSGAIYGLLDDLWKYDIAIGQWAWMGGSQTIQQAPNYGSSGVASPTNWPGAREDALTWTDPAGNLWLYGGLGYNSSLAYGGRSDLWMYDPVTREWTWMDGDQGLYTLPVVGTPGIPAPTNTPGARADAATWVDPDGNFFLFGGRAGDAGAGTADLWKYNAITHNWAIMKGTATAAPGVYGAQGIESDAAQPGSRYGAVSWTVGGQYLWLFGGAGVSASPSGVLNDLWRYNILTNNWTWMAGSSQINQFGQYGTQGEPASGNCPGARQFAAGGTDGEDHLYLFGGEGYGKITAGTLNDLWQYDLTSGNWTWLSGSDGIYANGVYGTMGTEAPANNPGARFGSGNWSDASGNFYLFGGSGYSEANSGLLNDLWRYSANDNSGIAWDEVLAY